MPREFNDSDEGKRVKTADGEMVGTVEKAQGREAQVRPDAGLSQSTRQRLGWTQESEEVYALKQDHVEEIDDSEIRISNDS